MKHKIYFFLHSFHKQFGVFSNFFCVMAQGIRWLWYNNSWCSNFFGELNPVLIIILITFRVFYYFKRSVFKKNYSTFILVVCAVVIVSGGKPRWNCYNSSIYIDFFRDDIAKKMQLPFRVQVQYLYIYDEQKFCSHFMNLNTWMWL